MYTVPGHSEKLRVTYVHYIGVYLITGLDSQTTPIYLLFLATGLKLCNLIKDGQVHTCMQTSVFLTHDKINLFSLF